MRLMYVWFALVFVGCGGDGDVKPDGGADADADADADSDSDADADADTDADTDTDADADTDTDTDTDADADADTVIHTGPTGPTGLPSCWDEDLGGSVPAVWVGTTVGRDNSEIASCGGDSAADLSLRFTAPATGPYLFTLDGATTFDAVLSVHAGCGGPELGCDDALGVGGEQLYIVLTAGQEVIVVVDGYDGAEGDLSLSVDTPPPELCAGELDDDLDGLIDCLDPDCSADPGCQPVCPDGVFGAPLPGEVAGDTVGSSDDVSPSCARGSSDVSLEFTAPATGDYVIDTVGSGYDTTLVVLDGCGGSELACSDDHLGFTAPVSQVRVSLTAGQVVVLVADGHGLDDVGSYVIGVAPLEASESDCADGRDLDDDGLTDCFDPDCGLDPLCAEDCIDGIDNDNNGLTDCFDPDCVYAPGCPESCSDGIDNDSDGDTDCADLACSLDISCVEICADGIDNDGDGDTDCQDAFCSADPLCSPICPVEVLDNAVLPAVASGTTLGAPDAHVPSCVVGSTAPDRSFSFTAPTDKTYTFSTIGSTLDTVLSVLDGCGGATLGCNDDVAFGLYSELQLVLAADQEVVIVVDGFGTDAGEFELSVD